MVKPDHPAAWSRLMARNALLRDDVKVAETFSKHSSSSAFFAIAKAAPWNESTDDQEEDSGACSVKESLTQSIDPTDN